MSEALLATLGANALAAAALALVALAVGRVTKRPAVAHALWLVVLLKLLTPPAVELAVLPVWLAPAMPAAEKTVAPAYAGSDFGPAAPRTDAPASRVDDRGGAPAARSAAAGAASTGGAAAVSRAAASVVDATVVGDAGVVDTIAGLVTAIRGAVVTGDVAAIRSAAATSAAVVGPRLAALDPKRPFLAFLALGSVAVLALAIVRLRRLRRLLDSGRPVPAALATRVERLAARVGLGRPPRLRLVDAAVSPMVRAGWGRPTLILPAALVTRLDRAELDAIMVHELAHLRRRDHWVRWLELAATVFYWWHPAVWSARRALRRSEERACDAHVARVLPGAGRAYARGLLATLELVRAAALPPPPMATAIDPRTDLEERLRMIVREKTPKPLSRYQGMILAAVALALVLVLPTRADRPPASAGDGGDDVAAGAAEHAPEHDELRARMRELEREAMELEDRMEALHAERRALEEQRAEIELEARRAELDARRAALEGESPERVELMRRELEREVAELELRRRHGALERELREKRRPLERRLRERWLELEEMAGREDSAEARAARDEALELEHQLEQLEREQQDRMHAFEAEAMERMAESLAAQQEVLERAGEMREAAQAKMRLNELAMERQALAKRRELDAEREALEREARALHEAYERAAEAGDEAGAAAIRERAERDLERKRRRLERRHELERRRLEAEMRQRAIGAEIAALESMRGELPAEELSHLEARVEELREHELPRIDEELARAEKLLQELETEDGTDE